MRYAVAALIVMLAALHVQAQVGAPSPSGPAGLARSSGAFGIDAGADGDPADAAREGLAWVRIAADWSVVEPARGKFVWTRLDAQVNRAAAAGIRAVLVLMHTPQWAALEPGAPEAVWRHQPPRSTADWQRFVAAAASRYRGRVAAWQVELVVDFVEFRGTFRDYTEMLHAARGAIRQADPQALVVASAAPGLDLAYVKTILDRAGGDFDALILSPRGRAPEDVLEALTAIRGRGAVDEHHQLWLDGSDAGGPAATADDAVGDHMVRLAVAGLAGGVTREFWSGRQTAPRWTPVRRTILRALDGARLVGWLPRGAWLYAFVASGGGPAVAVMWSTAEDRVVPIASDGALTITAASGAASAPITLAGKPAVPVGRSPVFVQGLAPAALEEASRAARQGPFLTPRDAAHDFSRADGVSVVLGAVNTERGLYNQRFRSLPAGAVVVVTVDGAEAVRTDAVKDAVYVYLDVDHSYAYFIDGREDLVVAVEVHRAKTAQQVGFNLLYDSTTGYRFTPWQWVEPGTGWVTYSLRLTDAAFSSAWGWDLAVNGAGDKKEPLVVRSVSIRKVPRSNP